ncbi:pyridoxamine 5'-phosphate oxidase family protein [Bailinhaonella thermotolerans]|uniref:Pyridoxamine 5'-phosphate oxidase n=1 Tax=Bailinhaonella thermotolerans TaxID=1070861 RepID=A0A3A4A547_9ACTN|nr:pyridoxamine 5'-phosphate oxidase family protein [Bailinhaonella thermotolerans]RJL22070.1 pyridoxamine 5'-phosphate oxidase [Bailinhaonella thermotolerans]
MATWEAVERAEPELAATALGIFSKNKTKMLATLRGDGSPRISGVEFDIVDGELWMGMMYGSRKALDLRRDPRFALHSAPAPDIEADPAGWEGDAKISGVAVEVTDPELIAKIAPVPSGEAHLFRADIRELTWIRLSDPPESMLIDHWSETDGRRTFERK